MSNSLHVRYGYAICESKTILCWIVVPAHYGSYSVESVSGWQSKEEAIQLAMNNAKKLAGCEKIVVYSITGNVEKIITNQEFAAKH